MAYSDFFSGGVPTVENKMTKERNTSDSWFLDNDDYLFYSQDVIKDSKSGNDFEGLDEILAGNDQVSDQYISSIKSIYDGLGSNFSKYEGQMLPLIDLMSGDIDRMVESVDDYASRIHGMEDVFMNGITLDPSATRTREEYMGNVASQFAGAEDAMRRDMASQGQNPYGNTGSTRGFQLARAAATADAGNQAYTDWRKQSNQDAQAKQQAAMGYANLLGNVPGFNAQIMGARGNQGSMYTDLYRSKNESDIAKAQGFGDLLQLNEARRTENLELGKHKEQMDLQKAAMRNQLYINTDQNPVARGLGPRMADKPTWGGWGADILFPAQPKNG